VSDLMDSNTTWKKPHKVAVLSVVATQESSVVNVENDSMSYVSLNIISRNCELKTTVVTVITKMT